MKKILFFITLIFLLLCIPSLKALAYSDRNWEQCTSDQTCMLLCGYSNKIPIEHLKPIEYTYQSSYIYYSFEKQTIFITFSGTDNGIRKKNIDEKTVWGKEALDLLLSDGKCPKYSFVDVALLAIKQEVCFDNDGKYCKEERRKLGTKYTGESTLEYNYEDHIATYFAKLAPSIPTCEEISDGKYDVETKLTEDFAKNFMFGKPIEEFILKSDAYVEGKKVKLNEYEQFKNDCIAEAEKSDLSDEEKKDLINNYENSWDNIKDQVDNLEDNFEVLTEDKIIGSNEVLTPAVKKLLKELYLAIKILTPILAVVLSMFDFAKAIAQEDKDALKKSYKRLTVRIVIVLLVFLLPTLINLIGSITGLGTLPADLF